MFLSAVPWRTGLTQTKERVSVHTAKTFRVDGPRDHRDSPNSLSRGIGHGEKGDEIERLRVDTQGSGKGSKQWHTGIDDYAKRRV